MPSSMGMPNNGMSGSAGVATGMPSSVSSMSGGVPAMQASHQLPNNGLPTMPSATTPNTAMPNMVGGAPGSMPSSYPGAASGALTGSSASYRMADTSPMPGASTNPAAAYPSGSYNTQPSYAPPAGSYPGVNPNSAPPANGMMPSAPPAGSANVPAGYRPGSTRESTYDFSRSAPGTATTAGASSGIPPMPSVGGSTPTQYPTAPQYPSTYPTTGTSGLPTYNGSVTR